MIEADTNVAIEPQRSERPREASSQPSDEAASRMLPQPVPKPSAPLLLVDDEVSACARLRRILTGKGSP